MSRSEWFDGPAGPGDGSARPEGSDEGSGRPPRATGRRRRGPLGTTLLVMLGVVVVGGIAADLLTDVWWYDSVGFRAVFVKELTTKLGLFVVAGLITGGAVASSLVIAYRTRPLYIPVTPAQQVLEQYRQAIEPLRRIAVWAVPIVLGLLAGSGSMGAWRTFLLWVNRAAVRRQGPPVRPRRRLLRLQPAVAALPRQLRDRRARPGLRRRGVHPLRLRRAPDPRPRADHPRRLRAPRHPRCADRADPRRVVLARPLLAVDPEGLAAHRHHLHRRQRRPADQGDPRRSPP